MRDGVELSADVYLPEANARYPVILARTPYVKSSPSSLRMAREFAARGYAVVWMDVRGRGDSDGEFVPYRNDGRDGYDAVEWCAVQEWSTGAVATHGGSYLARIQWLTAVLQPPHLRAMIPLVSPSDPFVENPTGTSTPMHACWMHMTSGRTMQPTEAVDWMKVYEHLPLCSMDEAAGRVSPQWRADAQHESYDDYWREIAYQDKFERVRVPVLHVSGWYDDEQIGTPLNYRRMVEESSEPARSGQRLLMGPWSHQVNSTSRLGEVEFGPDAVIDLYGYEARWLDRWLKGEQNGVDAEPPVRIFIMGENVWRNEREWPLARTSYTPYYLRSGGSANSRFGDGALSTEPPSEPRTDSYTYDPARPLPFITEPVSAQIGGPDDYAAVQRREDVLVYVTEPLEQDTEVTGPVSLELYAASSAPDTDFTAMLLDVHPSGFAQRLCDGMVRARFRNGMDSPEPIAPGEVYRYEIDLWNTAQRFGKGHRICLQLASSAFPKYDRNLNTGESLTQSSRMQRAEQTVYHGPEHPSRLILPLIPAPRAAD